MRAVRRGAVAGFATLVLLAACGGQDGVSDTAAAELRPLVQGLRAAAATGDRQAALARLEELRRTVGDLRGRGQIGEESAARVLAAAGRVEANLALLPTTTTSAPRPPTTRNPPVERDDGGAGDDDDGKGSGKGKKGRDDDGKKGERDD